MSFLTPLGAYVEALVHPSARTDARIFARHFFFIASRLSFGLIAFAALPVYLAVRGVPSMLEAMAYWWLLFPMFAALYVSRTGAFERAHILSAAILAIPLGLFAGMSGLGVFALWVALVPIEAIFFCSRSAAIAAGISAFAVFGLSWGLASSGFLPVHLGLALDSASLGLTGGLMVAANVVFVAFGARAIADNEARLQQASERRYRWIAHNTSELITSHGRNGAVTFASSAAESLLGTPAHRLMGHGLFDRIHIADRPAFLTAISDAAIGKKEVTVEYRLRRDTSESFIWVESRCRPDASGATAARAASKPQVVAVTQDISSRKAAELALEAARGEAEQANDAKYRFLATVSHELRTPLNAIIGFSEILMNAASGPAESRYQHDYAKLIRDSGEHLLAVVNSILDVSRIETGQFTIRPKSFSIGRLVESVVTMMALAAEKKGVLLSAELAAALPEIVADERAVRQILLNLLSNAIKFTGEGGSVAIGCRTEGDGLLLSVADSGIGVAEKDLGHLGSPFFQAHSSYDRPYEGSGLGLAVVKGLAELHGGSVDIASRLGEGTKVAIRLPLDCRKDRAGLHAAALPAETMTLTEPEPEKVRRRA
ncbi:MAG TPA: ATP-binding protein [Xanthobacteraceae bacterium]|nr:ATP-binding protein [Xanthobacteraceae bacterium]